MPTEPKMIPIMTILRVPAMVVGAIAAMGVGLNLMGFEIQTPGANLRTHVQVEHLALDTSIATLNDKVDENTHLMKALVIGYCMEHEKNDLDRAGLTPTCRAEGIIK